MHTHTHISEEGKNNLKITKKVRHRSVLRTRLDTRMGAQKQKKNDGKQNKKKRKSQIIAISKATY